MPDFDDTRHFVDDPFVRADMNDAAKAILRKEGYPPGVMHMSCTRIDSGRCNVVMQPYGHIYRDFVWVSDTRFYVVVYPSGYWSPLCWRDL